MSGFDWAWVVIAAFWGLLVLALCYVLVATSRLLRGIVDLIHGVTEETVPLIGGLGETVSGVNVELARVDAIIASVQHITHSADGMVGVLHATISTPLIKASAYVTGAAGALRAMGRGSGPTTGANGDR